jgi:protocatechuate 3,4-dioxygenase beta subunit
MLMRALAILAAAGALAAQSAPEPSSLSGTVTNSVTGEPVLRAHVTVQCWSSNSQQPYGALTNEKGEYSIATLPPGQCTLTVQRVGFVEPPSGVPNFFNLTPGTHKENVKLTLTPTGTITGSVVNAAGEPAQGVNVSAEIGNGSDGGTTTDDKGQFRIGGLRPGKYRVKASPPRISFPPEIRADGSTELQDAATYYPGSLDAKSAQRLEVKAGADVSGVDIKLVQVPITLVSGKVDGIPPGANGVMVTTQPAQQGGAVKPDGTFRIWRLDPGKYTLQAHHWGQTQLMSAPVEIEVASANLEHIELRIVPPFEIAGQLRFDDEQARAAPQPPKRPDGTTGPAPPQPHFVQLAPLQRQFVGGANVRTEADESFTLSKVQPARYRVNVRGVSGFVKSLRAGDTEVDGDILDLRNGSPGPVTVTLSSNFCEISGTVSDANGPVSGARLALRPVEDQSGVRSASSDPTGAYKFRVPPGKYKLAVVDDTDMAFIMQSADLDDYAPETLELSAGDKIAKDLVKRKP